MFLEKLRAQGWLELFTNTQLGCSQPDLTEFYTNVSVPEGLLTSTVNGVLIEVDVSALGLSWGSQQRALTYMSGRKNPCWTRQN